MSQHALNFVWQVIEELPRGKEIGALTDREALILSYIGNRANNWGTCYPSNETIARATRSDTGTISRALNKFERMGLLRRETKMKKGRGRMPDTVVLELKSTAATWRADSQKEVQQHGALTAATCASDRQQHGALTDPSNKGNRQQRTDNRNNDNSGGGKALPVVDGERVSVEEFGLAQVAIAKFNDCNGSELALRGTTGRATENLKRIVCRLRETPGMTGKRLEQIIERCFANPYWSGQATVGNIFGPKAWQKALVENGVRRSERKAHRAADRTGRRRRRPDW